MVKTRSLYLTWAWFATGLWHPRQTDRQTDGITIANTRSAVYLPVQLSRVKTNWTEISVHSVALLGLYKVNELAVQSSSVHFVRSVRAKLRSFTCNEVRCLYLRFTVTCLLTHLDRFIFWHQRTIQCIFVRFHWQLQIIKPVISE